MFLPTLHSPLLVAWVLFIFALKGGVLSNPVLDICLGRKSLEAGRRHKPSILAYDDLHTHNDARIGVVGFEYASLGDRCSPEADGEHLNCQPGLICELKDSGVAWAPQDSHHSLVDIYRCSGKIGMHSCSCDTDCVRIAHCNAQNTCERRPIDELTDLVVVEPVLSMMKKGKNVLNRAVENWSYQRRKISIFNCPDK